MNFRTYLRNAEKFALQASEESQDYVREPLAVISTIFAWSAIEAFVNSMLEDFASVAHQFEYHEQAFLQEKRIRFVERGENAGRFVLEDRFYRTTEHKVMFLIAKFGGGIYKSDLDLGNRLWQSFLQLKEARNSVVHPRNNRSYVAVRDLEGYIETAKEVISVLGRNVWKQEIDF